MKYKIAAILSIFFIFFAPFLVANAKAEYTLLEFSPAFKNIIVSFFPEGWRFFTKSPRGNYLTNIYEEKKGGFNNIFYRRYLGFSRFSRALKWELKTILDTLDLQKHANATFPDQNSQCLSLFKFKNTLFNQPYYVLEMQEIPAWHWRKDLNIKAKKRFICLHVI